MYEEINFFTDDVDSLPFIVQMSGISYCDGSYYIKRAESRVAVIEYIEKGTGTVRLDGKEYTASEGDVYILPSGHSHEYFSSSSDPWVKKFFNIKGTLFDELLRQYSLYEVGVIRNCDVKAAFDEIYAMTGGEVDWRGEDGFFDRIAVKMHRLLAEISQLTRADAGSDELLKVKHYIDANLQRVISNDELSAMIFRSNDYLIKNFHRRFGQTPYSYQLDRRILAAKRLLQYTLLPIGSISERVGYRDRHYFSYLFKQKCGVTPMEYRKNKK